MIFFVIIIVVFAAVVGVGAGWAARRRARRLTELHRDWWAEFERQFRAYAAQHDADRRREARHKPR